MKKKYINYIQTNIMSKMSISIADIDQIARKIEYDKFYIENDFEIREPIDLDCICLFCTNARHMKCNRSCCETGIKCILFNMRKISIITEVKI